MTVGANNLAFLDLSLDRVQGKTIHTGHVGDLLAFDVIKVENVGGVPPLAIEASALGLVRRNVFVVGCTDTVSSVGHSL
jgi:hypothetical protein